MLRGAAKEAKEGAQKGESVERTHPQNTLHLGHFFVYRNILEIRSKF